MIPEKPQHNNVVLPVYTLGETLFFVRYPQCVIFLNEKKVDAFCCFGFIEGVCVQQPAKALRAFKLSYGC